MPEVPVAALSRAADEPDEVVVTLLGVPEHSPRHEAVVAVIGGLGGSVREGEPLPGGTGEGIRLRTAGTSVSDLRPALSELGRRDGFDVAVVPASYIAPGPRLLVLDVDSTLIEQEVIELLAAHAGREAEVRAVTERAMRGELDFAQSLVERVRTLAGLPVQVLDETRAAVRLTPGAERLVGTMRRHGFPVGVVSGGFSEVVEPLAAGLGIDHVQANRLEVADGRLTGRVEGRIVDRGVKAEKLREWAGLHDIPLDRTLGIGDGANDLDMLAAAGLGVAFDAKPAVREAADATITPRRLDLALHYLGL